jgi:CRP-like cAMP-binding protein
MSTRDGIDRSIDNHILAALPRQAYQHLLPHLKLVKCEHGEILYETGQTMRHVYFPNDSVVSLVYITKEGISIEVGVVGKEGMVGIPVILGATASPYRAVVQIGNGALRMKADVLRNEFRKPGPLQTLLHQYTHGLMMQISRTAVCNRIHTIEERLARWLLMVRDRMKAEEFKLTHEFLADMLGVRRAGVSLAAGTLQEAGLIRYARGRINIINSEGLESVSCECYKIGREDFAEIW